MAKATDTLSLGTAAHAAKRAADVIYIFQNREGLNSERLTESLDIALRAYGETNPNITQTDLDELKLVSGKLFTVFKEQDTVKTAILLNELLQKYAQAPRLSAHANTAWHIHVDSDDHAPWAEWFAASSTFALAILFAEKQRNPGGLCNSETCGRPFIDLGKGGRRKYCSSQCASRERVGAYRKRNAQTNS
jgi:predicted RNA-binding Zn ribbon-like protein